MNVNTQMIVRKNPNNIKYLRENSKWYKYLNRSTSYISEFEKEMKISYKLTAKDKLDRFTKNIDRVSEIIDIFS
ncbi:MAG: YlbE-like family protein [bacterium]|nr:YlbE-like family protein [bacterium]